jgi:uncharacterized membrane protein YgdD (TMEM256/DUF423 family)
MKHLKQIQIQIFLACMLGALAVIAGAFSAHLLERFANQNIITLRELSIFEKAVRYQMYHALVLLVIGVWNLLGNHTVISISFYLIFFGIVFFSGTLYWIALQPIIHLSFPIYLFWVTPLGGLCMIVGWILIFFEFKRFYT